MIPTERPTIPYTELKELPPGHDLCREWNTYLKELPRLLAEGKEGKFVLIKGTEIFGLFDSWGEARSVGLERFLLQPMLVHEIRARVPLIRVRRFA